MTGHPAEFMGALNATGYLQAIALFQVIGGLLLIVGRFVPLGLTLLGPIVVNILLYHIFLDRSGMPIALVVCAIFLFLVWRYRTWFLPLLQDGRPATN